LKNIRKIKLSYTNRRIVGEEPYESKEPFQGTYDHNNPEHYKKRKQEEAQEKDKRHKEWDDWVKTND
jgi:hypothetical protein